VTPLPLGTGAPPGVLSAGVFRPLGRPCQRLAVHHHGRAGPRRRHPM